MITGLLDKALDAIVHKAIESAAPILHLQPNDREALLDLSTSLFVSLMEDKRKRSLVNSGRTQAIRNNLDDYLAIHFCADSAEHSLCEIRRLTGDVARTYTDEIMRGMKEELKKFAPYLSSGNPSSSVIKH